VYMVAAAGCAAALVVSLVCYAEPASMLASGALSADAMKQLLSQFAGQGEVQR
jgi:hypothetical protein